MDMIIVVSLVLVFIASSSASAFEFTNVERSDPTCEKSLKLVKNKFGKPDEILQLTSNSITTIYRSKRLHFTFEIIGRTCTVTSSDF